MVAGVWSKNRDAICRGVSNLARSVKVTLGPKDRNVILRKSFGSPTVPKGGVNSDHGRRHAGIHHAAEEKSK